MTNIETLINSDFFSKEHQSWNKFDYNMPMKTVKKNVIPKNNTLKLKFNLYYLRTYLCLYYLCSYLSEDSTIKENSL